MFCVIAVYDRRKSNFLTDFLTRFRQNFLQDYNTSGFREGGVWRIQEFLKNDETTYQWTRPLQTYQSEARMCES